MPSDKLPRRMLSAWVYQAKGRSARKRVAKLTTYGGTVARYHFKYVLMNPSVHPDVREALAKEVERRNIKTGKTISLATLKADKFYDRAKFGDEFDMMGPHRGAPGLCRECALACLAFILRQHNFFYLRASPGVIRQSRLV
jgi:hypothetical protein